MSDTVNPNLELGQRIFKDLVWDTVVEAAIAALKTECPALAVPPLSWITDGLIHLGCDYLFKQLKLAVDMGAIPLLNEAHKRELNKASAALYIIAQQSGIESEAFRKARDEARAALAKFVRVNA